MPQSSEFSTVNGDGGFDAWHHQTCRIYSVTECPVSQKREFQGSFTAHKLGELLVGDVHARSQDGHLPLIRNETDIRRDPRDYFMLFVSLNGELGISQSNRTTIVKAGDIALYDQASPFALDFGGDFHGRVMAIPRKRVVSRLAGITDVTARSISGKTAAGHFAHSILSQYNDMGQSNYADITARMESSVLDLIFGSIEHVYQPDDGAQQVYRERQLSRIKEFLLSNLQDTQLNIDTISASQGVSARTLNRLFSIEGTTPMRWLWKQRLEKSYEVIAGARTASITDVAFDFGFSDVSHFSRAFKKEFGRSPVSILRRN